MLFNSLVVIKNEQSIDNSEIILPFKNLSSFIDFVFSKFTYFYSKNTI